MNYTIKVVFCDTGYVLVDHNDTFAVSTEEELIAVIKRLRTLSNQTL